MKTPKIKKAILKGDIKQQQLLLQEYPADFIVCCVMLDALWVLQNLQKQIDWQKIELAQICPLHYATSKKMADFWIKQYSLEQLLLPDSHLGDAISFQEEDSTMRKYLEGLNS